MINDFLFIAASNPVTESAHEFGVQPRYILSQIISFLVVLAILYFGAFKKILSTLDDRQRKIESGLKYADEMKLKLAESEKRQQETLREASQKAALMVDEARATAKDYLEKQTREAGERAEQILKKAEEAITLERKKMLAEVRGEIARLVVMTSSKVLARELSDDERSRFNSAAARELTSSN